MVKFRCRIQINLVARHAVEKYGADYAGDKYIREYYRA